MKKLILSITLLSIATLGFSQQITRSVVASSGNYSTNSGVNISSTIGEAMVTTLSSGSFTLTQGFQQPVSYVKLFFSEYGKGILTINTLRFTIQLQILLIYRLMLFQV